MLKPSKYQYKNQNLPHLLFLITLSEFSIPSNPSFVSVQKLVRVSLAEMNEPKYGYPYAAQGQGDIKLLLLPRPPVMAPPQYAAPPPRREPGFLEDVYLYMHVAYVVPYTAPYTGKPCKSCKISQLSGVNTQQ
ncbi:hypothetical protein Prudu_018921 [Prunus dulcis]|uniref:Uncharacterized protein n=1 Tax=Prunus dulcis TaxID=3755 RepID=A0A4Y1RT28_PRUDU|nr:hypothetical protein Prudu_018921 [Prunus dulcis]